MRWNVRWHATLPVCWVPQEAEGSDDDYCSGWYFADAVWGLNGPYGSPEDAAEAKKEHEESHDQGNV